MRKKKIFSLLGSTVLMAGLLSACGSEEGSSAGGGSSEQTTLTLLRDTQSSQEGMNAVAKLVEEKYGIKTEFETRPGGTEGDNIVKTRLATGDMADIAFYNSGSLMQALNPEKNFVDLTNEPFMENVMDSFKETVTANGKVYGAPALPVSVGGWFYNKKVYKELGLSVPKTWDELMANNEKIKKSGKTAVIGSYKDTWTSQLIVLADNHNVIAEDPSFPEEYTANKAKMATTPAALKSFEKLQEVHDKGYMNEDFLATTYDNALKMLAEGTGVHYPMLSQVIPSIEKNYPELVEDIGVFPQPGDSAEKNGFTVWMPAAFYVNKNSENVDAAKKWLEVYLSQEGIETYLSATKPEGPFAVEGVELPDDVYGAVKDMMPYFDSGKTTPALEFLSPIKGPNLQQITTEVGSGIKSAKEGAKSYDTDVEKQAKQLGLEGW
ncbi:extracellular solute-binding protein [Domibacillus sp. PGB-M46]|uniref:ABC transporter substrate-binding protein n=1 Tax=Domibacillus sp. PGB-M46 TaxID=2910255 RepID=UPI001F597760|nr:extracellular solute-binding protein [Domibacillus sp. PGB-M46]MCI2255770.1 extracellular solute-binding protein [Domibacillus sp. PGB-M46]